MLPGLGHPELQNSEQHSSEKRKREDGGNQQSHGVINLRCKFTVVNVIMLLNALFGFGR